MTKPIDRKQMKVGDEMGGETGVESVDFYYGFLPSL